MSGLGFRSPKGRGPDRRVLIIGLDCAAPRFVFGPDAFDLPCLRDLMARGVHGMLRSCDPPITIPAWTSMMTGLDPGVLGLYGFRNRADHSYAPPRLATSNFVKAPRLWDWLSQAGYRVAVLGVPQTFPPPPVNGWLVSGLLTPDTEAEFTYPPALKGELLEATGDYLIDVEDFRTADKDRLLDRIHRLMENRFAAARFLLESKPWDFFMMVEMGMDRLHHGFWRYCDPHHPKYEQGNRYEDAFRDFYRAVDCQIGRVVRLVGENAAVLVVSDHGAKALHGGFRINQWLLNEGYLHLRSPVQRVGPIEEAGIDWSRTRVWASGGYCGRLFFNVHGREPQGILAREEYVPFRDKLASAIEAVEGPAGRSLGNRVLVPSELYESAQGVAPDMMVYFGDLHWRAVGTVGHESLFTPENDTGPDDANHDLHGVFVMADGANGKSREISGAGLQDIAPTVLDLFGLEVPPGLRGSVIDR